MVQAVTHYKDPDVLAKISEDLGEPMVFFHSINYIFMVGFYLFGIFENWPKSFFKLNKNKLCEITGSLEKDFSLFNFFKFFLFIDFLYN